MVPLANNLEGGLAELGLDGLEGLAAVGRDGHGGADGHSGRGEGQEEGVVRLGRGAGGQRQDDGEHYLHLSAGEVQLSENSRLNLLLSVLEKPVRERCPRLPSRHRWGHAQMTFSREEPKF